MKIDELMLTECPKNENRFQIVIAAAKRAKAINTMARQKGLLPNRKRVPGIWHHRQIPYAEPPFLWPQTPWPVNNRLAGLFRRTNFEVRHEMGLA